MSNLLLLFLAGALLSVGAGPHLIRDKQGRPLFPIGSYELPKADQDVRTMAASGINLVRCNNRQDMDRAQAAGLLCVMPLPLDIGISDGKLRALIQAVVDHPALAVWEGPDEIVWNFTAYSGLFRNGTYPTADEWWRQTPLAIEYAEKKAALIIPNLLAGIRLVRDMDKRQRPVWINEAARSDLKYIREYLDAIDITGCDIYPIHAATRKPSMVADHTERYKRVGKGRPVWMVLQGFAWGELAGRNEPVTYPTFGETRLMAWSAIARGAAGILYWGMDAAPPAQAFRESLYAMTSELGTLQPFLTAPDNAGASLEIIDDPPAPGPAPRVVSFIRQVEQDWLVALVNEDNRAHMGVVVNGLTGVIRLQELHGSEEAEVRQGEFVTRLLPHQVKVFATKRRWESTRNAGRDFSKP